MGQAHSRCGGAGRELFRQCHDGNSQGARHTLTQSPSASVYITCIDRNSPLLVAAAKGHTRMVQAILEAAVLSQGLSRAKKRCINHSNSKGQSALMLACISGHAQCVEVLVCNGASPLLLDNARHNSALHWAASCCRADCVGRLLGAGAMFQMQSGQLVAIADIPCFDEDNSTLVKFVDRHNGWGLTALHLAAYKGSSSTVRALLRHGASVSSRTTPPNMAVGPALQPAGSTALHFAAAAEDMSVVLVLLEAQVSRNEPDLRRATNIRGDRPLDVARSSSNALLLQLLHPSHALSLHPGPRSGIVLNPGGGVSRVITREGLRQHQALLGLATGTGFRASRRQGSGLEQLPHVTLGSLLQRLKLVLTLEAFALQQQLAAAAGDGSSSDGSPGAAMSSLLAKQQQMKEQQVLAAADDNDGDDAIGTQIGTATADGTLSRTTSSTAPPAAAAPAVNITASSDVGPAASSPAMGNNGSSGGTATEISPDSSGSDRTDDDDTRPIADTAQQQQKQQAQPQQQPQQQSAAETAAQRTRLRALQQLIGMINEMLAVLPASAKAAAAAASTAVSGSSSPRSSAASGAVHTSLLLQQQQQSEGGVSLRRSSDGGSSILGVPAAGSVNSSSGGSGWTLLGGLLARNGADHHHNQPQHQQHHHQQQQQRLFGLLRGGRHGSSGGGSSGSDGAGSAAAVPAAVIPEDILPAYLTASLLSSLGAVTKLFAAASSLSGQQQQPGALGVWTITNNGSSNSSAARWAEQEHALVLLKGVLLTVRSALEAAQHAAAAAVSRSALRQRHQQQLASLVGGDRVVHSHSLRRVLLGDPQGRISFGGGSSSRHDHHHVSPTAAYASSGGGMGGMSWGLDTGLGSGLAPPPPPRHSSRRHHRGDRSMRRMRGGPAEDSSGGGPEASQDSGSRRHHHSRHHSRHHRSSRRNRTPRAVDLPLRDSGGRSSASEPDTAGLAVLSLSPRSNGSSSRLAPNNNSTGDSSQQQLSLVTALTPPSAPLPAATAAHTSGGDAEAAAAAAAAASSALTANQQHQQYLQQLAGILREHMNSAASWAGATQAAGPRATGTAAAGTADADGAAAAAATNNNGSSSTGESLGRAHGGGRNSLTAVNADITTCPDDSDDDDDDDEEDAGAAADASSCSSLDAATCAICMDCTAGLNVSRCSHSLCLQCAYQLCYKAKGVPLCPFCRQPIDGFEPCPSQPPTTTATPAAGFGGGSC